MSVMAIDPGPDRSAWVLMRGTEVLDHELAANDRVLATVVEFMDMGKAMRPELAIEMIASYGMPVGASVFNTCVWIGRFAQAAEGAWAPVFRRDVKLHLCNSPLAKDGNVRQAIIDRYPRTGGGKTPQIGTKARPGPLYGVTKDVWSAIGVGITYQEMRPK